MLKREVIRRMDKTFGYRNGYLTAPAILNQYGFCYVLLQNEETFHLKPRLDEDGFGFSGAEPLGMGYFTSPVQWLG